MEQIKTLSTALCTSAVIGLLFVASSVTAAEDCIRIKKSSAMLVCMDKQSVANEKRIAAEKPKSAFVDPTEALRAENDKVTARLKGICRGC